MIRNGKPTMPNRNRLAGRRSLSPRLRLIRAASAAYLLLGVSGVLAAEPAPADRIATGDTAEVVISKLGSGPDRIETSRLLGVSYQFMTFRKAGSLITVRLIFDRVIDVETRPTSFFGTLE
jgi:hypothetical protein